MISCFLLKWECNNPLMESDDLSQLSSDCLRYSEIQFLKSHWIISKQKRINAKFFMELYDTSISFSGLWFYGRKPCGHMSNLPPWFLAQVKIWQREGEICSIVWKCQNSQYIVKWKLVLEWRVNQEERQEKTLARETNCDNLLGAACWLCSYKGPIMQGTSEQ